MNAEPATHELLFFAIKSSLPSNVSLVHEISELLGISYDSAYRRIRGEKELTLDELKKLCLNYKISLDRLFDLQSGNIIFNSLILGNQGISFMEWFEMILKEMKKLQSAVEKEVIYITKDLPIFHYLEFPEIFAFKLHFWHKVLIKDPSYKEGRITLDVPENFNALRTQVATLYGKIPKSEVWNEESLNSLIRQIEFCYVSGYFLNKDDALRLCDAMETMVQHLQRQAEAGFKYLPGTTPEGIEGSFKLYCNEVLLGDNMIYVKADGNPTIFFIFDIVNLLITSDPVFCQHVERSLRTVIHESVPISSTSAKDRSRFFIQLIDKINVQRKRME